MHLDESVISILYEKMLTLKPNNKISKIFVHKKDFDNVLISELIRIEIQDELFSAESSLFDSNIYFSRAFPNLNCNVCFDHALDHYPLMVIFELGRQIGIAATHFFYDIPLEGFMNIVDNLSFEFVTFCELDQDLYVVFIEENYNNSKTLQTITCKFLFIQNNRLCAKGNGSIKVMPLNHYKRFRKISRNRILSSIKQITSELPTNTSLQNNELVHKNCN